MAKLSIGVIGLGNFGNFLIESFDKTKLAEINAISDNEKKAVDETGNKFEIKKRYYDFKLLLKDPTIDLVIIATPPFSHYEIAKLALLSGKYVWVEKPPTILKSQLEKLIQLAKSKKLKIFIDFELRFSPLWEAIGKIIKQDIFGPTEHFRLENFASDERLGPKHWFWDKKTSGGIFVEHNIHFFDLYSQLYGKPKVEFSYSLKRQSQVEDRVLAGLVFQNGIWATVYHSFTRPGVLESTATDFKFQRGYLKIEGWIPEKLSGRALLLESQVDALKQVIPISSLSIDRKKSKETFSGNWQQFEARADVKINWRLSGTKKQNYRQLVNLVLDDIIRAIFDKKYHSKIDLSEAMVPLNIAYECNQIADNIIIRRTNG